MYNEKPLLALFHTTPLSSIQLYAPYNQVIGMRRASWRVASTVEQRETNAEKLELIRNFKADIEKELEDICADIIGIPISSSPQAILLLS